ncbi:MAG: hypothetical protein ACKOAH_18995, partial [Pirellula sp.]
MGLINKTNLLFAGLLAGGLYFASQHYTLSGLDQLRIESKSPDVPSRDWSDPRNWLPVTHQPSDNSETSAGNAAVLPSSGRQG